MTPWAKARFDAEKPGYGPQAPRPAVTIPSCNAIRSVSRASCSCRRRWNSFRPMAASCNSSEREHEWRPIWLDGRPAPEDPDPTWFGYAIGHWEGDDTLVVQSTGFNDKTWLGPNGFPHSEDMRVTERYRRVDHDTIVLRSDGHRSYRLHPARRRQAAHPEAQAKGRNWRAALRLVARKRIYAENPRPRRSTSPRNNEQCRPRFSLQWFLCGTCFSLGYFVSDRKRSYTGMKRVPPS